MPFLTHPSNFSWNPWYPLTIGKPAQLTLTPSKVETKIGRKSGRLVLVSENREHITDANWSVRERRDVVYLKEPDTVGVDKSHDVFGTSEIHFSDPADFSRTLIPDRIMLFRFSALTFNSHRIHYDINAVRHEGHPDLIVHGPMISLLLLDLCARHVPNRTITKWKYRALSPFYVDRPLRLFGRIADDSKSAGSAELWAMDDHVMPQPYHQNLESTPLLSPSALESGSAWIGPQRTSSKPLKLSRRQRPIRQSKRTVRTLLHMILPFLVLMIAKGVESVEGGTRSAQYREPQTSTDAGRIPIRYRIQIVEKYLIMADGVGLSARIAVPVVDRRRGGEGMIVVPALLDYRPYRKDDSFYMPDMHLHTYFARRGFIVAQVDIRGTGASHGQLIRREYTEQELRDGAEVIRQLSCLELTLDKPGGGTVIVKGNGKVGMYGKSWSAFNSVMLAAKKTPGLAASDGPFFEHNSVMLNYSQIDVPLYLNSGLYDGYRDYAARIYEGVRDAKTRAGKTPQEMKMVLGPWNHAWPQDGPIGPRYSGADEAVRWFDRHMKTDAGDGDIDGPGPVTMYIRDAVPPGRKHLNIPGRWFTTSWPIPQTRNAVYHILPSSSSNSTSSGSLILNALPLTNVSYVYKLSYKPSSGTEMGTWFGEPLPDMRSYDGVSIVFDSEVILDDFAIAGFPKVSILVSAEAPLAHWVVRLEDVWPDGHVSHVTGALRNGAYRNGRQKPEAIKIGEWFKMEMDLHLTTWTFRAGHRVRLAVSNAVFRMAWPTPFEMRTSLMAGAQSSLRLPVISIPANHIPARFVNVKAKEDREDKEIRRRDGMTVIRGDYHQALEQEASNTSVFWSGNHFGLLRGSLYGAQLAQVFDVDDNNPAQSRWLGFGRQVFIFGGNTIKMRSAAKEKFSTPSTTILNIADFDGVGYRLTTPESKTQMLISMRMPCFPELIQYGAMDVLRREYGVMLADLPEPGYEVTLKLDLEKVPQDYSESQALIRKIAMLKRNALAAPFERAFDAQMDGRETPLMAVHYRDTEVFYVKAGTDRVTVIFSTEFKEEQDKIFGKVFLQEFVDARRLPQIQNAPQVLYTNRDPPLELRGQPGLKDSDNIGYVTFVLFPRHFTKEKREDTISKIQLFRDYLHYHIKCSKSYMHSRMRARVAEFLKVLNRAKPEPINVEKKTIAGKTFKRS
ncbi:hypothetical protein HDU93_007715 [Gonapodya sp. JEL0774]|nr:hypothetical protein HDU93_007715 [Gonapodya sp. JEL0774]